MQASWVAVNAFDIWILITLVFEFWAVPMWLRLGSVLSWTRLLVSLPSHLPVGVFCVSQLVQSTIISSQVRLNSVLYYIAYYCNNLSWAMSALTVSKCSSRRVVYNQVSVDTSCVVSILLVYSIVTGDCSLLWSAQDRSFGSHVVVHTTICTDNLPVLPRAADLLDWASQAELFFTSVRSVSSRSK